MLMDLGPGHTLIRFTLIIHPQSEYRIPDSKAVFTGYTFFPEYRRLNHNIAKIKAAPAELISMIIKRLLRVESLYFNT